MDYTPLIGVGVSTVCTAICGLLGWGVRTQVDAIKQANKDSAELLTQKIETVRQEFHAKLSEAGDDFYKRVNGNYVRKELYERDRSQIEGEISKIDERVGDLE